MKTKTLIINSLLIVSLHAQEQPQADPYRNPTAPVEPSAVDSTPRNISICYEAFSLPLAMAAELQRKQLADPALYAQMIAGIGNESVRQESFQIVRTRSGQKATTESVTEHIYPTEFERPLIGNISVNVPDAPGADSKLLLEAVGGGRAPATPKSFETRSVGTTLEVEAMLSEDLNFVDLRLVPEHVTLVGRNSWGQEFSTAEMPEFETQRLNTGTTLVIDRPFLLGTQSRPPVSKIDPDSAHRVWFAFVTVTLAKP